MVIVEYSLKIQEMLNHTFKAKNYEMGARIFLNIQFLIIIISFIRNYTTKVFNFFIQNTISIY